MYVRPHDLAEQLADELLDEVVGDKLVDKITTSEKRAIVRRIARVLQDAGEGECTTIYREFCERFDARRAQDTPGGGES